MRSLREFGFLALAVWPVAAGFAAESVPASAADEIGVARAALRDGLWSVARAHVAAITNDTARLIVLESYAAEDRWNDVKAELAKGGVPTNDTAFAYYQAVVDGRLSDAAASLRASGSLAGAAEAKMLEADLALKRSDLAGAKALWGEVVAMSNASVRAFALASVNLGDVKAMREAYAKTLSPPLRRRVGLRLGQALLGDRETEAEGAKLIRAIVTDVPDTEGAREAYFALADAAAHGGRWKEVVKVYADAVETWPGVAKRPELQEGRGEALYRLGRHEEALAAFALAEEYAGDDASRARAVLRQGDVLSELGRGADAMLRYRTVLAKYPVTETAVGLKRLIDLRERETRGRDLYKGYRFEEARQAFAEVAEADPTRRARMAFFEVLCLYGLGSDEAALDKARDLARNCTDPAVRAEAVLWLAKFTYNRGEWQEALELFVRYAELRPTDAAAPSALLWAVRAAFAANDFAQAIQIATRLAETHPTAAVVMPALLVQAEALIEQSRYDEAVLVLDRVASDPATARADGLRARLLKANALFAMGADNPVRYQAALEAYRAVSLGADLEPDERLSVAFKIGRVLEKLKRTDEAIDQYYSQVVLAYGEAVARGERFGDTARAAFARAAFALADEFEGRGRDYQAVAILRLVKDSGVPAAEEAVRRIAKIYKKGQFL